MKLRLYVLLDCEYFSWQFGTDEVCVDKNDVQLWPRRCKEEMSGCIAAKVTRFSSKTLLVKLNASGTGIF